MSNLIEDEEWVITYFPNIKPKTCYLHHKHCLKRKEPDCYNIEGYVYFSMDMGNRCASCDKKAPEKFLELRTFLNKMMKL